MRVVTMYPDQPEYVAHSLQNAGQCFMDLYGRALNQGDIPASDELLIKSMKLMYECAGRFGRTAPGVAARKIYRAKKADLEKAEERAKTD
jgi:hypothetical protein